MEDDEFQDCEELIDDGPPEEYTDENGFTIAPPKNWKYSNMFTYENDDLKEIFQNVSPGNTEATDDIKAFDCPEKIMQYGNRPQRLVFYADDGYTDDEKKAIKEVKEYYKKNGEKVKETDAEILRCLYGRKMHIAKAHAAIQARIDFRTGRFPMNVDSKIFDLINSGYLYIQGRDRFYRPLLVLYPKKVLQMKPAPSNDELIASTLKIMQYAVDYMCCMGHVENFNLIVNQEGTYIMNLPINMVRTVLGCLQTNHKCRARTIFVLNANKAFSMIWRTVSMFIDENTARKVQISSSNSVPDLLEMVAPNQLEKQFGGTAPDREEGGYWPPSCPDSDFGAGGKTDITNVAFDQQAIQNIEVVADEDKEKVDVEEQMKKFEDMKLQE